MFSVGRICIKIAGRDAGKQCVIVDTVDDHTVLIDGQTRRRKCNVLHLEPTEKTIELAKGASHDKVKEAFTKINVEIKDTTPKKAAPKPTKQKAKKETPVKEKAPKKVAKKEAKTIDATVAKEAPAEEPVVAEKQE